MLSAWYALRSKTHKEHALSQQARLRGYEVFYPRLHVSPVNPRSRKIIPYFPGYLFIHTNLREVGQTEFQRMPFSLGLVSFGGEPAYVPEAFIHALKQSLKEQNSEETQSQPRYQKGEQLFITGVHLRERRRCSTPRFLGRTGLRFWSIF